MIKKLTKLTKTLLVAAGLCVGASDAWAGETTTLLEYGTGDVAWTNEKLAEWTAGGSPTLADGIVTISGGNGSYATSKTISPTANAIINVTAVWRGASSTGRTFVQGNGSYFRFGNIVVAQNDQDQKHGYTFAGLSSLSSVTTFTAGSYRTDIANCTWLKIEAEINTATNKLTSFTIKSEDGTTTYVSASDVALTSPDYTTVAFGYFKSGSVSTTNTEQLKSVKITQTTQEVETADYTINYKDEGTTVKTVSGNIAVGVEIAVLSSFWDGTKKYVKNEGQPSSLTVKKGGSVLDVAVSEATKYTCTVNAKAGETLLASINSTVYDGEKVRVFYKKAYKNGDIWYMTPANGSYPSYAHDFSDVSDNSGYDVTTYVANENIAYFSEVEEMNLSGSFAADGSYTERYSNGAAKRLYSKGGETPSSGSWIYTDAIPAGVYTVSMWGRNQSNSQTATLDVYLRDSEGNMTDLSTSFDIWDKASQSEKSVEITIPNDGKVYSVAIRHFNGYNSNLEIDYVYVTFVRPLSVSETITAAGWATLYTPYALDFSDVSGLTAYTATCEGSTVTLTEVTDVPANTGVVLKGNADTYDIPVIASSETAKGDLKGSTTEATNYAEGKNYYYLALNKNDEAQFIPLTSGSIAAGKAYLEIESTSGPARQLTVKFADDVTGISNIENEQTVETGYYNLSGQRVAAPSKGLYIMNGKKVIMK